MTRTAVPSKLGKRANRSWAPAISQDKPSHTRTVSGCGAVPPSLTMSKWW